MAWTTILASQTDADSPLNQVLFDAIRENLDYLKDSFISPDNYVYHHLGGVAGAPASATPSPLNLAQGAQAPLGEPFNLPAPPSGKQWALEFKAKAKLTTSGTVKIRMYLKDSSDAETGGYADTATLTASYTEVSATLYVTTAYRGRLVVHAWGGGAAILNGAARAYQVAV